MSFRLPKAVQRDLNKPLPADAKAQAINGARRDAIFAGMSAALVSAVIGSRFMGFGRTQMMLGALGSGVLSGYYFQSGVRCGQHDGGRKERERLSTLAV
ncbi:hypothetical protein B0H14DRAFT_2763573 [Mycena olivaceomarginata]|nr:hypothetical protein B0H14DRAFT_2763573 [Mycena olivaceomarginata]